MPDISDAELAIVQNTLNQFLSRDCQAYIFGSRASGTARRFSDLDLPVKGSHALSFSQLALLQEAFAESDLPYRVDIVDWHRISEEFRQHINPKLIRGQFT